MTSLVESQAFDERAEALKPYVPRLMIEWIREKPQASYSAVEGTLVFVDVSGFTALTERLAGRSGTVEVTKEGRHVATLGPGDFVGEIALLHDVQRVATVTATSDTVLQALDRATFIPAVTGQGEFRDAAEVAMATRLAML